MHSLQKLADGPQRSQCLVVFLPGFGDDDHAFVDHGFVDALRARGMRIDTVSADATFGYYMRNTIVTRLHADVLDPARQAGYRQIWVVGVSMGGLGALLLAKEPETPIAGVYLLAPYLGDEDILHEIDQSGGVARWNPGPVRPEDYQRDLWRYLQSTVGDPAGSRIYLGAGDSDKLEHGHRLLASILPTGHVFRVGGRHDWGPWATLWSDFLDRSDFRAQCDPL
jgi:pimeloyl-ACP methyl ester carboxylesterase